jgi:hypothetical protein
VNSAHLQMPNTSSSSIFHRKNSNYTLIFKMTLQKLKTVKIIITGNEKSKRKTR